MAKISMELLHSEQASWKLLDNAIKDANGKIKKTAFPENKHELEVEDGDEIIKMNYEGCPHWNNKEKLYDFLDG